VPQVHYAWGVEDNPVTVAHWALQNWSWWLDGAGRGVLRRRTTPTRNETN
jgi:hypothetical protein